MRMAIPNRELRLGNTVSPAAFLPNRLIREQITNQES
jgi:hypothetical protein